jgi:hypothetical protein
VELRKYAYENDPKKVKRSVVNDKPGAIQPKCEEL